MKISHQIFTRPRYGEVDQMGYVYHANYVNYCHQSRTELLRQFGIDDNSLESKGIMMPVIEMNLRYHKPAKYDELITIKTIIHEIPVTRFAFEFEIRNEEQELLCTASSTIVFVNKETRKPMKAPAVVTDALTQYFQKATSCN